MAKMGVSAVIVPEIYQKYFRERTIYGSKFWKSGIIKRSPNFDKLVAGGGTTFNFPFSQSIVGVNASEVLSDSSDLTVYGTTTAKQIARRLERGTAYSVNDLAKIDAGQDFFGDIMAQLLDYWDKDKETTLINSLTGVFADNIANDSSDLVSDISLEDGNKATDANLIGPSQIMTATHLLGDKADKFSIIAMHSVCYLRLKILNLIDFRPTNVQDIGWGTYLGMTVVVEDSLPADAGATSGYKYTSYIFQPGSIAYGESYGDLAIETDRLILAGDDRVASRAIYTIHPAGFAWADNSVAGNSPTDAELAMATNWNRVFEKKNIGIVKLVTNG